MWRGRRERRLMTAECYSVTADRGGGSQRERLINRGQGVCFCVTMSATEAATVLTTNITHTPVVGKYIFVLQIH